MPFLIIAAVTSAAIIVIAIVARDASYHVAPLFLLPAVWGLYRFRQRLNLRPVHYALIASAILLHMMGAFGWYQKWSGPFSFDILVHYWFALVVTLAVHRVLIGNWPLRPWQATALTFFISMGLAAMHEIMEFCSYLLLGEERGMLRPSTSYFFDTQRDLTNNLLGTLTALAATAIARRRIAGRTRTQML
jgi:uncharacterized membrane protein YjdF